MHVYKIQIEAQSERQNIGYDDSNNFNYQLTSKRGELLPFKFFKPMLDH